jgi:peptidyl-prolyl cis-trans isomerase C
VTLFENAWIPVLLAILLSTQVACDRHEPSKSHLARVGDTYLTRENIVANGDSAVLFSDAQLRDYITRWVNNELLYQEARRLGFENSQSVQRQTLEARKRLTIEALMEKEVFRESVEFSDDSIHSYFSNHPEDFFLRDDVIKLQFVAFQTREAANAFRSKVQSGTSWRSALEEMAIDPAFSSTVAAVVEERYYTQHTLYPPELWRVANNLALRELSFPVKVQDAFFIIQPVSIYRQGTTPELDLVRDEIRQRLLIEERRRRYGEFLNRLRGRYDVEVVLP